MNTPYRRYAIVLVCLLSATAVASEDSPTTAWPSASPESVGLDAGPLAELDAEIASGKLGAVDSMLVIRRGKVVYDRAYARDYDALNGEAARVPGPLVLHGPSGPYNYLDPWWHPYYRRSDLHTMQSATKTVLSVTIGAAVARGHFPDLDTPVLGLLGTAPVANVDDRKRRITIRHLLTMTPGLEWREDVPFAPGNSAHAMEATCDWSGYVLDRPMAHEPGTVFHYSSGASQLLVRVFRRSTGQDLEEYAARHVFGPLGIDRYYWKRTPDGEANGEGGLYLRPHDLAKIGYLFLKNGVWDGKAIVSPEWVKASVAPAATVSEATGVKYGFQWWLIPHGDDSRLAWAAAGWGGQMLIVVPELELVLVFTGWSIDDDAPRLRHRTALERVLQAVKR